MSNDQMDVTFDDLAITVRTVGSTHAAVSDRIAWTDIERVCFADGGLTGRTSW